jgi:hypothetical protein
MKKLLINNKGAVPVKGPSDTVLQHFSGECREKLQVLKHHIQDHLVAEYGNVLEPTWIQQVVNEADALAAFTPFPVLFLPTLAEEKAQAVINWQGKQQFLRAQGVPYALAA